MWEGQPTVTGATPGMVVLCGIRKQTEEVMKNKAVISSPLWPLDQLLPFGSCLEFLL